MIIFKEIFENIFTTFSQFKKNASYCWWPFFLLEPLPGMYSTWTNKKTPLELLVNWNIHKGGSPPFVDTQETFLWEAPHKNTENHLSIITMQTERFHDRPLWNISLEIPEHINNHSFCLYLKDKTIDFTILFFCYESNYLLC